ncbi:MAG: haloacid dehalogenase-like hydrolase [Acutalibacteraceae bacterium]|nr:haloacid dehalogenase-like hydrolase [Acutalibacteraceae bacterium]
MNVYDFDNTIYKGDSTADFFIFCLRKHPKIVLVFPKIIGGVIKFYLLKKGTKTEFKEKVYTFLQYCDTEKDVQEFWNKKIGNIKSWYKHQQRHDDVIISASPEFLLETPCKLLDIKHLMASRVDPNTGKYNGENCHGKEKVRRFYEKYSKTTTIHKFYSDSYSDTPLAELAEKSYMVKGNKITKWIFK